MCPQGNMTWVLEVFVAQMSLLGRMFQKKGGKEKINKKMSLKCGTDSILLCSQCSQQCMSQGTRVTKTPLQGLQEITLILTNTKNNVVSRNMKYSRGLT